MVNLILFVIVGTLAAVFVPHEPFFVKEIVTSHYGDQAVGTSFNYGAVMWATLYFFVAGLLSTVVRFVGPKRVHVITFLGTTPMQQLKTGIRFTLPLPFGWTHAIVPTDVQDMPLKVQVKPKDNLVYHLPVNAQWYVDDALKYAIERNNPRGQLENLLTATVRTAGNERTLFEMYGAKDEVKVHAENTVSKELASFGVALKEIVVQDPDLPESTAKKLSAIREAEFTAEAAVKEGEAVYIKKTAYARAEADSMHIKGKGLKNFRLSIAEGNAAAVAVMQGKLAVKWTEETIGEGENATTVKVAKFVPPASAVREGEAIVPEIDITPGEILEFFKVIDGNDAVRDAASQDSTTVVLATGVSAGTGIPASLLDRINKMTTDLVK